MGHFVNVAKTAKLNFRQNLNLFQDATLSELTEASRLAPPGSSALTDALSRRADILRLRGDHLSAASVLAEAIASVSSPELRFRLLHREAQSRAKGKDHEGAKTYEWCFKFHENFTSVVF